MKLVDDLLDGTPPMIDGALVAVHLHLLVVLGELALVEFGPDSRPIGEARLIGADDRATGHHLPRFHQEFVLLVLPTKARVFGVLRLLGFIVSAWFTVGAAFSYLAVFLVVFVFIIVGSCSSSPSCGLLFMIMVSVGGLLFG